MHTPLTITNTLLCRVVAPNPNFIIAELYKAESNGHKYAPGETRTLTGLESCPEYDGEQVQITAIRKDGKYGKAYYVKGRINEVANWVYEYYIA